MPYLGPPPSQTFVSVSYQDLTGGSGTGFTLDYPVSSANEIEVFVNNVRQEPGVAYTVAGTTLTMTGSIASTDDFYVVFQGKAVGTISHPSGNSLQATNGTFTGNVDINGNELILDADADTSITADTDDQIDIKIGGSDVASFSVNGLEMVNGKGIYFGATANGSGTTSSELFDDYEEGTFTPTITSGVSSITYTAQSGYYTKIGDIVYADFYFQFSGTGTGTQFTISSLPFAVGSGLIRGGGTSSYQNLSAYTLQFYGSATSSSFTLYQQGSTPFSYSGTITNSYIIGTFIYKT